MMIFLGNKQNSLILLGFFSFSRMEIPVYNLGECTPWDLSNRAQCCNVNGFAQSCLKETDNGKLQQFNYSTSLITNRGTVERGKIHSARAMKENTQTWRALFICLFSTIDCKLKP